MFERQAKLEERKKLRKQAREEKKQWSSMGEPETNPKEKYQGKRKTGVKKTKQPRKDSLKIELVNENSIQKEDLPVKEDLIIHNPDVKKVVEPCTKTENTTLKISEIQNEKQQKLSADSKLLCKR